MKKYRPKVKLIEAIQFTRDNFEEVEKFTNGNVYDLTIERRINGECYCYLDGNRPLPYIVYETNYIVKTTDGSFYRYDQKEFEKKYEEV